MISEQDILIPMRDGVHYDQSGGAESSRFSELSSPSAAKEVRHLAPLWRNRDFMLLWSGQLLSSVGGEVSILAFPLLVLGITHSAVQAGLVGALRSLPFALLCLPAGAFIDRWDRKRVMLICDTGRALALGSIPVALWLGRLGLLQLCLVVLVEGTLMTFFSVAQIACLPHVVPKEQIPAASAQNQAIDSTSWTLKTRIVHLTEGVDFLGFNIRHYPAPQTARSGWKLLIKPSKESVREVQKKLKDLWKKAQGTNAQTVLGRLNPVIRGWANYFRTVVAKEVFSDLDRWMFHEADHYIKRMHPRKSKEWQHQKYWGQLHLDRNDLWVFGDKQTGAYLLKFSWFPIERHTLVKGRSSPDDLHLKDYWAKRQAASARDLTFSKQKLAKGQKGRCLECGESLFNEEELHVHHLLARSKGGKDRYDNLVLVHLLCHQQIHAKTERAMRDCQQYNDQNLLTEEVRYYQQLKCGENEELCCS